MQKIGKVSIKKYGAEDLECVKVPSEAILIRTFLYLGYFCYLLFFALEKDGKLVDLSERTLFNSY
jgi:hypothetical protein